MNLALRLTTASNKAIQENHTAAALKKQAEDDMRARKMREAIAAAERHLEGLEQKLMDAADLGSKSYEVIRVDYADYNTSAGNALSFSQLKSDKIKHIYQVLDAKDLNPSFEYQHDGVGLHSWFCLTANWK